MAGGIENDSAVKVAVRQRPLENAKDFDGVVKYEPKSANIILIDDRPFCFDYVLGPEVMQKDLFDELIDPLVEKVKQGYNCTALAYGQTGTGKSYTMGLSTEVNDPKQAGVVRHCLWKLLKDLDQFELSASFIEIYNERAFDLLTDTIEPIMAKGYKFTGGVRKKITSVADCNDILKQGICKRHVRPTVMNSQSSRSHAIFTIELLSKSNNNPTRSCLNLVDLAGSEGVRRTGHIGVAMSEGVHINQGLLSIGKILQAMSEGQKVIPYRDSVLGSVLQDSLNSNSYLTLLACISAKRIDLSETLSTIRFAQRAKQVKRTPRINSILMELNKTKSKTPHNIKMLNNTKNSRDLRNNISNGGQLYKTFCTPGKVRQVVTQLNSTEMGLTPKEKEKAKRHLITTSTAIKPRVPTSTSSQSSIISSTVQRESLFEHTMESWNLNISSSTTVESLPNTNKPMSYSPIVQKCMEKFETVLENKMQQLMQNLQKTNTITNNSQILTPINNQTSDQLKRTGMRSELKSIMREILSEKDNSSMISVSSETVKVKCQLFTTSSPVFKVPEIPSHKRTDDSQSSPISTANELSEDKVHNDFITLEESLIQPTIRPIRRSVRLMERTLHDSSINNSYQSNRLDSSIKNSSQKKRSSIERLQTRRRSTRIAARLEEPISKPRTKPKNHVNNSIIASYFNESSSSKPSKPSKPHGITKHRKAILSLLNTGSMRELQVLPQIGQKTAFQLVTHRTLNGKFKTMAEVEKLPIWRGNAWERFANANMLI